MATIFAKLKFAPLFIVERQTVTMMVSSCTNSFVTARWCLEFRIEIFDGFVSYYRNDLRASSTLFLISSISNNLCISEVQLNLRWSRIPAFVDWNAIHILKGFYLSRLYAPVCDWTSRILQVVTINADLDLVEKIYENAQSTLTWYT